MSAEGTRPAVVAVLRAYVTRVDEVNCPVSWCGNPYPHIARTAASVQADEDGCVDFTASLLIAAEEVERGKLPQWWPTTAPQASTHELCWVQPGDDRLIACDRAKDHKGKHSWEAV